MSVAVVIVVALVVVFALFGALFTVLGLRARRRRQRRAEHGIRAQATVTAVEPSVPEGRGAFEQPFVLAYADPAGRAHEHRFTDGFGGIVPAEGWSVEVLFDPEDPANVEITDNPYLHGVAGAEKAERSPLRRWLLRAVVAVTALLLVGGLVLFALTPTLYGPYDPAYTRYFLLGIALVFYAAAAAIGGAGADFLATAVGKRRVSTTTGGVITQTWTEIRSSSDDDGPSKTRVYPYAVRFALPDGRQVHRRAPDTPAFDRNRPGQQVEITYQPADPTGFTVGGPGRLLLAPVLTLLFSLVFAAVATLLAVIAALT
ncbi:DUF3592 domain-containing protein [Streptomonospora wellingtoniae]|uniref:DUF3592 domain-containing protein n=1 Tax=Streptomonospora wellingtoniae TaxID=3075544 RepID=A0ABU2KV73_9ACTN|nr:DUF3592 domain-containing protein [Streptomonospora sp. DSM 45055]MDT0303165.1 DUF3592 domain-containing protein [Streptomonospora sp. DSM 45055]